MQGVVEVTRRVELGAGRVRVLHAVPAPRTAVGHVVMLPGLALPSYLLPLARALAAGGAEVSVLDLVAVRGARRVDATVEGLAEAAAEWLARHAAPGPVLVFGHSTGAQVAAEVALAPLARDLVRAVVLAGPTFAPAQRTLPRLALATSTAYRHDTPRELVVARDVVRVRTDIVRILRSGLRHRLEERLPGLTIPLLLMAGEADSFAPRSWLDLLAERAGGPSRIEVLPGSHNSVFPYAAVAADLVRALLDEVR